MQSDTPQASAKPPTTLMPWGLRTTPQRAAIDPSLQASFCVPLYDKSRAPTPSSLVVSAANEKTKHDPSYKSILG